MNKALQVKEYVFVSYLIMSKLFDVNYKNRYNNTLLEEIKI